MKSIFKGPRSRDCWWPKGYNKQPHKVVMADLTMLKGNIVKSVDRNRLTITRMEPTLIIDSPHYQYAIGNKQPYQEYLEMLKHITWARAAINQEHLDIQFMFDKFDKILDNKTEYLIPPYESYYIICNNNRMIIDGMHRTISLLSNNIKNAPVALVRW
jgi:hypothetical protein